MKNCRKIFEDMERLKAVLVIELKLKSKLIDVNIKYTILCLTV
jgi:hypothetical protein